MTRLNSYIPPVHPVATEAANCVDLLRAELAEARRDFLWARKAAHVWKAAAKMMWRDSLPNQDLARGAIRSLSLLLPLPERAAILAHLAEADDPPHQTATETITAVIGDLALFLPEGDKNRILEILYRKDR